MISNLLTKAYSISAAFNVEAGKASIEGFEPGHPNVPAIDPYFEFELDFVRLFAYLVRKPGIGLMAIGPTGSGKSAGIAQAAARIGYPVIIPTIGPRTEFADLLGGLLPSQQGFMWRDGPLTTAVRNGYMVVIEEFNILDPADLMSLVTLLDHGQLHIPTTDERIPVHPKFRLMVTGNAGVNGDSTGLYSGVRQGNIAFGDRFLSIKVTYLPQEKELAVLAKTNPTLPEEVRGYMVQMANNVRKLFLGEDGMGGGTITTTISTRKLRQFGDLITAFARVDGPNMIKQYFPKAALEAALLSRIPADEAKTINDIGQAVFGPAWQ